MTIEASTEYFAGCDLQPLKEVLVEELAITTYNKSPLLKTAEDIAIAGSDQEPITEEMLNDFLSDMGRIDAILYTGQSPEITVLVFSIRSALPQDSKTLILAYEPPSIDEDDRRMHSLEGFQPVTRKNLEIYSLQGGEYIYRPSKTQNTSDRWLYSSPHSEN